jgi:NAD+ synthase
LAFDFWERAEMVQLKLDGKLVKERIVNFIRNAVKQAGFEGVVVGVSGGLDSTVVLHLASEALGPQNVWAILLPYGTGDEEDLGDASELTDNLGVNSTEIDISPVVQTLLASLTNRDRVRKGNFICRIRMVILYDQAFKHNALVLGTGNRTEFLLGYFTKYGDGGVDLEPLGDLYKTQVRQLAEYLGVPDRIIQKTPTAGLWPGQTDESELGFTYEEADRLLCDMLDGGRSDAELLKSGFARELIERVRQRIRKTEHKRKLPPIARVTNR